MALVEHNNHGTLNSLSSSTPYGSACDTCRRRRVKCDGNQPCDRCTKSRVNCSFGNSAKGASSILYARQLERRISELEAQLRSAPQTVGLENLRIQDVPSKQPVEMIIGPGDDYLYRRPHSSSSTFYGRHSGLRVLGAIGDLIQQASVRSNDESFGRELVGAFEAASLNDPSMTRCSMFSMLPAKSHVLDLKHYAVQGALVGHDQLDHDEFERHLDVIYDTDPESYAPQDWTFLALVYIVMALARRYSPSTSDDEVPQEGQRFKLKGLAYYYASCAALNITDSHDLDSIRALICQTRYLASAHMLTKSYARISSAMAQALRMGLHVSSSNPSVRENFTDEELFQRRRVFSDLHMYETFMSSLVGIPRTTRTADATQTVGLYLAEDGRSFIDHKPDSTIAETATLERLCLIVERIMEDRHPITTSHNNHRSSSFNEKDPWEAAPNMVPLRGAEMQSWHNNLPSYQSDIPAGSRQMKAQLTVRMFYALAQLCLYRPFVHHLCREPSDPKFDSQGYEWASSCIKAAMQAIWVIDTGRKHDLFHEAFFAQVYTLCFCATVLVYLVAAARQRTTVRESAVSALKAIEMLKIMGRHDIVARRICASLTAMIEDIPAWPVSLESLREDQGSLIVCGMFWTSEGVLRTEIIRLYSSRMYIQKRSKSKYCLASPVLRIANGYLVYPKSITHSLVSKNGALRSSLNVSSCLLPRLTFS